MRLKQRPVIYCFRHDLRVSDNPGFFAAAASGRPVLPCYVLDDMTPGVWRAGGASRWWLHHSLSALRTRLKTLGGRLIVRSGRWCERLSQLAEEVDACAVYWSHGYEPYATKAEAELHDALNRRGVEARRFGGHLLFEPEQIHTRSKGPFKVFTPFWKACLQQAEPREPSAMPGEFMFYHGEALSETLESWQLLPAPSDWSGGLQSSWTPGEQGAWQRLETFLDAALADYKNTRDRPAIAGTSKLSPHLHFGEISPRRIWHSVRSLAAADSRLAPVAEAFLRELGWREFCCHLLYHWPALPEQPFRPHFANFPWREDAEVIQLWQQGRTGFPLVDAGMRELWCTGWMHNRVRMVAASLLVKNLLQPWQTGEAWFWDTLVDADLANNAAGWQWVAGCGADAAPYFRIFNPVTQSQKFDPAGRYIRRWVPELGKLSDKHIHEPWAAPDAELKSAGIRLGVNYPKPIVDHKMARQRALEAYRTIKRP